MSTGIVYTLNDDNQILEQFECDWDRAIKNYFNKRTSKGRYYVAPKGKDIPFKRKPKKLYDIRSGQDHQ